jgi:hypothetical protein
MWCSWRWRGQFGWQIDEAANSHEATVSQGQIAANSTYNRRKNGERNNITSFADLTENRTILASARQPKQNDQELKYNV